MSRLCAEPTRGGPQIVCAGRSKAGGVGLSKRSLFQQRLPKAALAVPRDTRARLFKSLFGGGGGGDQGSGDSGAAGAAGEALAPGELPFPLELLDDTFLKGKDIALAYRASRDGWSALEFHERCDFKGPSLVVATTVDGARFGGFNPVGWRSTNDYQGSLKAFLFSWPKGADSASEMPIVLRKVDGSEAAVFDYARGGPQWGADALIIGPPRSPVMGGFAGPEITRERDSGDLRTAKCRLGLSYEALPPGCGQTSLFGGSASGAALAELEVFYSPSIAKLY